MPKETDQLQTTLMNNGGELAFKLEPESWMHAGRLEFRLQSSEDSCLESVAIPAVECEAEEPE